MAATQDPQVTITLKVGEHEGRITRLENDMEILARIPERLAGLESAMKSNRWVITILVPTITAITTGLTVTILELVLHAHP